MHHYKRWCNTASKKKLLKKSLHWGCCLGRMSRLRGLSSKSWVLYQGCIMAQPAYSMCNQVLFLSQILHSSLHIDTANWGGQCHERQKIEIWNAIEQTERELAGGEYHCSDSHFTSHFSLEGCTAFTHTMPHRAAFTFTNNQRSHRYQFTQY